MPPRNCKRCGKFIPRSGICSVCGHNNDGPSGFTDPVFTVPRTSARTPSQYPSTNLLHFEPTAYRDASEIREIKSRISDITRSLNDMSDIRGKLDQMDDLSYQLSRVTVNIQALSDKFNAMSAEQRATKNHCEVLEERFDNNDEAYKAIMENCETIMRHQNNMEKRVRGLEETMRQISLSTKESQNSGEPQVSTSQSATPSDPDAVKTPQRGYRLVIHGLPDVPNEDCFNTLDLVAKALDISISSSQVLAVQRVPQPLPIMIKKLQSTLVAMFTSKSIRDEFLTKMAEKGDLFASEIVDSWPKKIIIFY